MRPKFQFSLRAFLLFALPSFALTVLVFAPTTVRIPVRSELLLNSIYYSEGSEINIYDQDGQLIVAKCRIVLRKIDIETTAIEPADLVSGNLPPIVDNSFLEIRVNYYQKYQIEHSSGVRVGGIRQD